MSAKATRHEARQALVQAARERGENAVLRSTTDRPGLAALDPGERYVTVEWIGEPSYLDCPIVAYKLLREGQPDGFTPHQASVIRAAARMRIGRFKGHNRAMGPESGLSRMYEWGPKAGTYQRRMTFRDAEILKATNSGHEFRIVGQEPDQSPLNLPSGHVRLMGAREFSRVETVAAMAPD